MEKLIILFNYKGRDILIRHKGDKFQMGFRGPNGINIWLNQAIYNSIEAAKTSGREYLRNIIDKIIITKKREV